MRPDFKNFIGAGQSALLHSAKGSTWENHKYIKRIDGTYYYPDSYEGGRHLPDGEKGDSSSDDSVLDQLEDITGMKREGLTNLLNLSKEKGYDSKEFKELLGVLSEGDEDQAKKMVSLMKQGKSSASSLSSNDVENLAKEVIRGNFDNGQARKDLLGENYQQVQDRVNEILLGSSGSKKVSEVSSEQVDSGKKEVEKVTSSSTAKGLDYEKIFSVYRKK